MDSRTERTKTQANTVTQTTTVRWRVLWRVSAAAIRCRQTLTSHPSFHTQKTSETAAFRCESRRKHCAILNGNCTTQKRTHTHTPKTHPNYTTVTSECHPLQPGGRTLPAAGAAGARPPPHTPPKCFRRPMTQPWVVLGTVCVGNRKMYLSPEGSSVFPGFFLFFCFFNVFRHVYALAVSRVYRNVQM